MGFMDFVKKHFGKIFLAVCLTTVTFGIWLLWKYFKGDKQEGLLTQALLFSREIYILINEREVYL